MPVNYTGTDTLHNEIQLQTDGDTDNAAGRVAAAMALKDNSVWINNRALKNDGPYTAVGPITSTNGFVSNGPLEINGFVSNPPFATLATVALQTLNRSSRQLQRIVAPTGAHNVRLATTGMQEGDWFEFFHPDPVPANIGTGQWTFSEEGAGTICYLDSTVTTVGGVSVTPATLHFRMQLHASPILGLRWQLVQGMHLWIRR